MKFKLLISILTTTFLIASSMGVSAQSIDDIKFMTEQYPPFNFEKDGKPSGYAVDCLVIMLERLNSGLTREDIVLFPWARGYHIIRNSPNTCLFTMTRTAQRENLFKWVGPLCASKIVLTAPKEKRIVIRGVEDLKKYTIGVVRDDVGEQALIEAGVPESVIEAVGSPDLNAKKLNRGRIDMWAYGDIVAKWILKKNGFNPDRYESVFTLKTGSMYYAFNKNTHSKLIADLQRVFDEIKSEGRVEELIDRYTK